MTEKLVEKTCILCKDILFCMPEPDWSDVTPGVGAEICCLAGHWTIDLLNNTTEEYRRILLSAQDCMDFVEYDHVKEVTGARTF